MPDFIPSNINLIRETTYLVGNDKLDKPSLSKTDSKIRENSQKIPLIDVSNKTYSALFLKKLERFLNLFKLIEGIFNSHTIITGASKHWDCKRLEAGKHKLFQEIGAEHVQLISQTGCTVDTHYFSAATVMEHLESLGGKRKLFEIDIKDIQLFTGKKCICKLSDDASVELQEIHLSPAQQQKNKYGDFEINTYLSQITGHDIRVIQEEKSGKFYVIDSKTSGDLFTAKLLSMKSILANAHIQETPFNKTFLSEHGEFPGVKFEKNSSQWEEAVKLLEEMKIDKALWNIVETDQAVYVAPSKHCEKISWAAENINVSITEKPATAQLATSERGVVLLTMNQTDVYEAYPHEILTYALQGIDVMAYNNPGKGLSNGLADKENVNASLEACYQYLKKKKIPDEKILAKGQCFGVAPTAWLGRKHPHINIMLDQGPANFHDVAMQTVNETADNMMGNERSCLIRWLGKMLRNNFIINGIARAIFGGWNVLGDLAQHRGNKIFNINVPDANGQGGDKLVPPHHPHLMLNSIEDTQGKKVTLSVNPGATHITDWWAGRESQDTVVHFLEQTGISQSLFGKSEITKKIDRTFISKTQDSLMFLANQGLAKIQNTAWNYFDLLNYI